MGKRGSAVTCGSSPRRRPYGADTAFISHQFNARLAYVDHEDRPTARRLPDALEPGIHGVGTHWIRGFMAFQLARYTRTVLLTVPE
jgi:hypothetical protein